MPSSIASNPPSRQDLADQYRSAQVEKEELAATHDAEINHLKTNYAAEKADLEDRFESSVQNEKAEQYDHLRNIKYQLNREEKGLEHTRDQVLNRKQADYKHEEIAAETDGRAHVKSAIEKYAAAEELERTRALKAEETTRNDHRKSAEHILSDSQKRLDTLTAEKSKYLEDAKINHAETLNQIHEHYQDARAKTVEQYASEAKNMSERAKDQLNIKRVASENFMHAFDAKTEDPFYQLQRFESELTDSGDAYTLRVRIPEYERKQFKVQVSGQEIQLQGIRSNDTKVDLEPGRSVATRSFQNVQERYALDTPVDGKLLTYKEDGEWLEYTIPKFGPNHHVADSFRKAKDMTDGPVAQELNFKYTLPTADSIQTRRNKTLG